MSHNKLAPNYFQENSFENSSNEDDSDDDENQEGVSILSSSSVEERNEVSSMSIMRASRIDQRGLIEQVNPSDLMLYKNLIDSQQLFSC